MSKFNPLPYSGCPLYFECALCGRRMFASEFPVPLFHYNLASSDPIGRSCQGELYPLLNTDIRKIQKDKNGLGKI